MADEQFSAVYDAQFDEPDDVVNNADPLLANLLCTLNSREINLNDLDLTSVQETVQDNQNLLGILAGPQLEVPLAGSSWNMMIPANDVSQSTVPHVPSSLPASQNWPGQYDFNVSFSQQEKSTKGVTWTHSKTIDKLYVGKDAPCPINFSTNIPMSGNVKIRAMALYSSPESASEVVFRCMNHSLEDASKNILEAEHLVRCESTGASYEVDPSTGRYSVAVPFENPPAGQLYSTYIYKFTCFSSCPNGPNRRPLMLVFTLERGNQILGRQKVDFKVCACPGRDHKSDEQTAADKNGSTKKRKEPDHVSLSDAMSFVRTALIPLPKKAKRPKNTDGPLTVTAEDTECYEFLKQMKKLYDISRVVKSMAPDMKKQVMAQHHYQQNTDSGSDA